VTRPAQGLPEARLLSATETVEAIANGAMTARKAMEQCLDRIDRLEPHIRAFVDVQPGQALAAALEADKVPAAEHGPLHGLPVAIKEVFDVAGMRCTWGTPIHEDRVPDTDATAVRRLREAGAIIVGTLVSTEYAIAAAGPTVNPHDFARTPGGSSSGPAAAVASGMVPCALGSQTIGSIVRPAAYCGVYGLKPTFGAIPGAGGMVLSPKLDHPGFLAGSHEDIALLCRVLFGPDVADPSSANIAPPPNALPACDALRILVVEDYSANPVAPESRNALRASVSRLEARGAHIQPFAHGSIFDDCIEPLYTIMCRDMAIAHGCDYDRASEAMSAPMRDLMERGRKVSDQDYEAALRVTADMRALLEDALGTDAILVSPPTIGIAPLRQEGTGLNRPQALWSLVGLPVLAIPSGSHNGMPLGIQAGAAMGREDILLTVAAALEPHAEAQRS